MAHVLSKLGYSIAIAHCNFQLRGEDSNGDELFVKHLADQLGAPFFSIKFNTKEEKRSGESTQMVARRLRYSWFDSLVESEGFDRLATAHTANDHSETIIYNLAKGTGLKGMRGIQASNGYVVRPLLNLTSSEVISFLKQSGHAHREDVSNASDAYARNQIRHHVIPELLKINESLHPGMRAHAERFDDILSFVEYQSAVLKEQYWKEKTHHSEIDIVSIKSISGHKSLLYYWLSPYGFTQSQLEDALFAKESGKQLLADDHFLLVDRDCWLLSQVQSGDDESFLIDKSSGEVDFGFGELAWNKIDVFPSTHELKQSNQAFLNQEKLTFPLTLRKWKQGDSFQPFGMKGRKLISDYLIDTKVNRLEKEHTMVLLSENEIVWLVGHRVSNGFAINPDCTEILHLSLLKND